VHQFKSSKIARLESF